MSPNGRRQFDRPDFEKGIETYHLFHPVVNFLFDRPDFEKGIETLYISQGRLIYFV